MKDLNQGLSRLAGPIREINEKYKHPRIKMTRMVAFCLLVLRLYLIGMLLLLLYKFISIVAH
jgi:hypothetical protein